MKILRLLNALPLLIATITQTDAWQLRQNAIARVQRKTYKYPTFTPRNEHRSRIQPQLPQLFATSSDSLLDSRLPIRRILWFVVGIAAALSFAPMRAAASTIAEPLTAKTAAAVQTYSARFVASPVSAAVELKLSLRLFWAALLGAALGKERSFAKHSAGVRTMALVAMGASAFTVCSSHGFVQMASLGMRCDPSRMAANVASGVGFVGAGVITTTASNQQNVVHGLTTAATIWLSAAVGVACGVGLLRVATTAAFTTISILRLGRQKPRYRSDPVPATDAPTTLASETTTSKTEDLVEVVDDDRDDDNLAEIHDTSVWDEHPADTPSVQHIPQNHSEVQAILQVSKRKQIVLEDDPEMEEVVLNVWKNSTHQDMHAKNIEQFKGDLSDVHRP